MTYLAAPAFAAPGDPPNPQPCENARETEQLTDNWMTHPGTSDPPQGLKFTLLRVGKEGDPVSLDADLNFSVDFSKLQSIFGATNSDYLEGEFHDEEHRKANIMDLKSTDFNLFHGSGQKAAPKVMLDKLRTKYVKYVWENPKLAESGNEFSDINGKSPKTIWALVNDYGQPNPPTEGGNADTWNQTWGKYWPKIPTAYSEYYEGKIIFKEAIGQDAIVKTIKGEICPFNLDRIITFIMPEFFRTTAVTGQLNKILVPNAAQSKDANNLIKLTNNDTGKSLVGNIIQKCINAFNKTPLNKVLQKITKTTSNLLNPIKTVYAQEAPCLKVLAGGKQGTAPYCPLPTGQLQPGDSCDGQNVVCNFKIHWEHPNNPLHIGTKDNPGDFDSCREPDPDTDEITCYLTIAIWPVFRIPFLSEIWNNSLYSDEAEGGLNRGIGSDQVTGRPGLFSFFTPQAIYSKLFPTNYDRALDLLSRCYPQWPDQTTGEQSACDQLNTIGGIIPCAIQDDIKLVARCVSGKIGKNLPGQVGTDPNYKERFGGATECNKLYVRDLALKPKALQENSVIGEDGCNLLANAPPGSGEPPGGGTTPPNQDNCQGKYELNNPLGNFGDPNCDFSKDKLHRLLKTLDPLYADYWYGRIIVCESGFNPNNWLTGDPNADWHSPDPAGAWGLLQMGRGKNGQYDHGDVVWKRPEAPSMEGQVYNAVQYNKWLISLGMPFAYWSTSWLPCAAATM
ncbi:hypothetical protein A3F02_03610 [Candidatus Curtissbacteria bacterium RIFCSPHIGHO2_12_FULL_38_9b]|uniref:Uncharacterized protein n=1 Tax=Candidatus Curtissbacteria bacterium RIFCSPHIGHO2_12_FULL_38_9b TaxID=1797720 RepID=A0A1F5GSS0_9BACT|nr:MAG: hypothetical protein A3F02_03610 [Candidatus Curtissbacteria bacterium RIFCSPHIGHO2_12_FULL_38_9b]